MNATNIAMTTNLPRFLYHGTRLSNLHSILHRGIRPRGSTPSNWTDQPSRPNCIYLSTCQGFAYGNVNNPDTTFVVFEIDMSLLKTSLMYPDEDFIADWLAHQPNSTGTYEELLPTVIKHIAEYKTSWKKSILRMGSVAYRGTVPIKAITRYCSVDLSQRQSLEMTLEEPVSSLLTYFLTKDASTQNTKWFFGDSNELHELLVIREHLQQAEDDETITQSYTKRLNHWLKESADRTGITVVNVR